MRYPISNIQYNTAELAMAKMKRVGVITGILLSQTLLSLHIQAFTINDLSTFQSPLFSSTFHPASAGTAAEPLTLQDAVLQRYACKRFRRYNETQSSESHLNVAATRSTASLSNPTVVQQALHCLNLARRTPTAFNTQPYKIVLVHSPEQKLALARYCLGPNGDRVRDSDCTAVFLADRSILWTLPRFKQLLVSMEGPATDEKAMDKRDSQRRRRQWFLMQFYISLFSSGYPLPRFLASVISFGVRTAVGLVNLLTNRFYPMPSLSNAETWSSKQVMMVAMTYMLSCTSLGLATIPMEGIDARGIRNVIQASSRYAVPLIVSTGLPFREPPNRHQDGGIPTAFPDRYPVEEVIFSNVLGSPVTDTEPLFM